MKKIILSCIMGILFASLVSANIEDFEKAEQIIKQKIACEELSDEQLEILGDYFMEQMHPGELHEIMDERMGGEGSESLKQVHINMGLIFYCGEKSTMNAGMMNMMMNRNMMNYYANYQDNNYNYSLINPINAFLSILIIIILILTILFLIKQLTKKPRRKNG